MILKEFFQQTNNSNDLQAVYLCVVQDVFLKKKVMDFFVKIIFDQDDGLGDRSHFLETQENFSIVMECCLTLPFLAKKKLVFFEMSKDLFKKKIFWYYVKNPSQTTCLVLFVKDRRFITQQAKKCLPILLCSQDDFFISQTFIANVLENYGVSIVSDARLRLLKNFSQNRSGLEQELEKICLFVGKGGVITLDVLQLFIRLDNNMDLFKFLYLFFQSNPAIFIRQLALILDSGKNAYEISGLLFWFVKKLLLVREMLKKNNTVREISLQLKSKEIFIKKLIPLAKKMNHLSFQKIFSALYYFNIRLKSNPKEERFLLNNLFFDIQDSLAFS